MKIPDYNKKIKHPTYLKMQEEIERLKEEYIILQNASDEVEEEKDKEIERLNNDIKELLKENSNKEKVIIAQDNIIKEVREYIEENTTSYYTDLEHTNEEFELIGDPKELLEILDKEKE